MTTAIPPRLFVGCLTFCVLGVAQVQTAGNAREWLDAGIRAFHEANFREAQQDFSQAVAGDPQSVTAHLYLAMTFSAQYIPGTNSTGQSPYADLARAEFLNVLDLDSGNVTATSSIASLYYNEKNYDEAEAWNKKVIALDPNNKEAYYTLGVIAWTRFLPVDRQARADSGQKPGDAGPIRVESLRQRLNSTWLPILDDGISNMQTALRIDPQYDDAMAYMNLLIRYRGDLLDSPEEWKAATEEADGWMQKALTSKQSKSQPSAPVMVESAPAPVGDHPLRVGSSVISANLIKRADPVYPPLARQARISGRVVFEVTIGVDGSVKNIQLVSGHPLLVAAARDAVSKCLYKPTLLNGQPIEVITNVEVHFDLRSE